MLKFIDTHAHLDMKEFRANLEDVLENCKNSDIEKILIPGVTIEDMPRIIGLIEKYPQLYGGVALHPSDAKYWDEISYETLKDYARHPKILAIGETGLDYYWDKTFVELQKHVFKEHIRLAKEVNKPLIIHSREASADILSILKETNAKEIGGVMHCFSGSAEFALECIKEGFYIALGGPVTFKNAKKPKEVAQKIPLDKLLLETDSPYLAPQQFRGKLNDPSKMVCVAEEIAFLRNISIEELAAITYQNSIKLFKFQ